MAAGAPPSSTTVTATDCEYVFRFVAGNDSKGMAGRSDYYRMLLNYLCSGLSYKYKKKQNMRKIILLMLVVLTCACHKDKHKKSTEEHIRQEYRLAIVLPTEGAIGDYWKKSIDWSLENLNKALIPQREIKVVAEWFNE